MDYKNSIVGQFESLPDYWWVLLLGVAITSFIIHRQDKTNRIVKVLTPTYVVFIVIVTLLNRSNGGGYRLELFWSYKAAYDGAFYLWKEIAINYLLFIPLGFLLKFRIKEIYKVCLIGICVSGLIEISQLIFKLGLFEFDDIIGNSIGCVLGAMIGLVIEKYLLSRKTKLIESYEERRKNV